MTTPPPEFTARIDVLSAWAEEAGERGEHLFYIRLPVSLQPQGRAEAFEEPLQEVLASAGIGEVAGGGSQLGDGDSIEYCGIDVYVNDRERGLNLIRFTMRRLGAPQGTMIEEFVPQWRELPL